jgi:polyphosphate kinase
MFLFEQLRLIVITAENFDNFWLQKITGIAREASDCSTDWIKDVNNKTLTINSEPQNEFQM